MTNEQLEKANELAKKIEKAKSFVQHLSSATIQNRLANLTVKSDVYSSGELFLDAGMTTAIILTVNSKVQDYQKEFDAL